MGYYRHYRYRPYTKRELVSLQYGGADEDVRQVFFALDPKKLKELFRRYEDKFGRGKRDYAEKTYYRWRAGEVRMSGEVSERLLHFLPPLLSFEDKYSLVARLWVRLQPSATIKVTVRPDTGYRRAAEIIAQTIEEKKKGTIPQSLRDRLSWLSCDDAHVAEDLLKSVLVHEGRVIREEAAAQIQGMFDHFQRNGEFRFRGAKTITIAGTTITIVVKKAPFYRRFVMPENTSENHDNLPARREEGGRDLAPIQKTDNLLSEALQRLSNKQQEELVGKAAQEALRIQAKREESRVDIDIAREKMEQLTTTARGLSHQPMVSFHAETEHAGTRLAVRKGCMTVFCCAFFLVLGAVLVVF